MSFFTENKIDTERHVANALLNAKIIRKPFPYFYVQNVFPSSTYATIQETLREKSDFHTEKFVNRLFADSVGLPQVAFMRTPNFSKTVLHVFEADFQERFGGTTTKFRSDLRLIRDQKNYKIGPHTDAPYKVVSLLFYLPENGQYSDYGTSIYIPRDDNFRCEGGPHHDFAAFERVWTAPFAANTCFGFWKTNRSFHGVEPIPISFRRDVLLFNIYKQG